MRIDYDVIGEDTVALDLLRFGERAADASPAFRLVADLLRRQIAVRFAAEGPGWAQLKPETVARKQAAGLSTRILEATGAGKESLTQPGGDNVEIITPFSLIFGSSVSYMGIHQKGAPAAKIPQRKVVDFGTRERSEATKILQRFVVEGETQPGYRIAVGV